MRVSFVEGTQFFGGFAGQPKGHHHKLCFALLLSFWVGGGVHQTTRTPMKTPPAPSPHDSTWRPLLRWTSGLATAPHRKGPPLFICAFLSRHPFWGTGCFLGLVGCLFFRKTSPDIILGMPSRRMCREEDGRFPRHDETFSVQKLKASRDSETSMLPFG